MRNAARLTMFFAMMIWVLAAAGGCGSNETTPKPSDEHADHDHGHGHDHGHDHDHAHGHGPHEGSLAELGSDHKLMAEWVVDLPTDKVSIYILDHDTMKPAPLEATEVKLEAKTAKQTKEFRLPAVGAKDAQDGKASQFEIVDPLLPGMLGAKDIQVTLIVPMPDKKLTAKLEAHEH